MLKFNQVLSIQRSLLQTKLDLLDPEGRCKKLARTPKEEKQDREKERDTDEIFEEEKSDDEEKNEEDLELCESDECEHRIHSPSHRRLLLVLPHP